MLGELGLIIVSVGWFLVFVIDVISVFILVWFCLVNCDKLEFGLILSFFKILIVVIVLFFLFIWVYKLNFFLLCYVLEIDFNCLIIVWFGVNFLFGGIINVEIREILVLGSFCNGN